MYILYIYYTYIYIYIYIYIISRKASHHNTLNITQSRWMQYNIYISAASFHRQERTNKAIYICIALFIRSWRRQLAAKYGDCTTSNEFGLYIYLYISLGEKIQRR